MYPNLSSLLIAGLLLFTAHSRAQSEVLNDLLELEDNQYFANRDSAYADPYLGLKKLIYGNKRFAENKAISPRQTDEDLRNTNLGQSPFAVIIGCADSRVPNEIIFDQGVGDLFITRTAGQVMAEASYGTIEYAVKLLETKLVVVLGHQSCGAVTAAMERPEAPPGHIVTLINGIKRAALRAEEMAKQSEEDELDIAIRENVLDQVELLRGLEPVMSRMYEAGKILIVGAVYNIESGQVVFLEETITSLPRFVDRNQD